MQMNRLLKLWLSILVQIKRHDHKIMNSVIICIFEHEMEFLCEMIKLAIDFALPLSE